MAKTTAKSRTSSKGKSATEKKSKVGLGAYIIQVTNMNPTAPSGPAKPGQVIQFQNNDQQNYTIQFEVTGGSDYLVGVLLPSKGTNGGICFLTANATGTCSYDIYPWAGGSASAKRSPVAGGPHTIVISSGVMAKADAGS